MKSINNNLGITLVSLVVTIIVIAILASTLVYLGGNIIKDAKLQTANTDMLLIQGKAETIYEKLSFEKTAPELPTALTGTRVTTGSNDASVLLKAGVASSDIEKYYLWDIDTLKSVGLEGVKPRTNEVFYINYGDDVEVISSIGFTHTDGKTYYKLSEIKDLKVED